MRPTLRAVLLLAAGFPVALLVVMTSGRLWTMWLAYVGAAVLAIGVDVALALPRRRLAVTCEVPSTLYIGDGDAIAVSLSASNWARPTEVELLCDLDEQLEPQPIRTVTLAPDTVCELPIKLVPRRRGSFMVRNVWLRWTGPFGLMARIRRERLERTVSVVPNVRAVRTAALRYFSRDAEFGIKAERFAGSGSEFDALREYAAGMDPRSIDWKHSARHRKLVCKEFRAERNHQIVLAIDSGYLMSEPIGGIPKLDHAINTGLLLAYFSLRAGDKVGLFGFDASVRTYAEPVGGMQNFHRLQQLSAAITYQAAETNFTLGLAELASRLTRRSLVIVLTDFVDTVTAEIMIENAQRLASRHLVVFVTLRDPSIAEMIGAPPRELSDMYRSVVAGDFAREREVVLGRLRRLGIHCIDVPPERVSVDLLNRYLDVKRRELI